MRARPQRRYQRTGMSWAGLVDSGSLSNTCGSPDQRTAIPHREPVAAAHRVRRARGPARDAKGHAKAHAKAHASPILPPGPGAADAPDRRLRYRVEQGDHTYHGDPSRLPGWLSLRSGHALDQRPRRVGAGPLYLRRHADPDPDHAGLLRRPVVRRGRDSGQRQCHPVPDRRESDGDCVPAGGHRAVGGQVQINPRQRNRDRLGRWLRGNSEAGPFGSALFAGITLTAGGKTTGLRAP